jgi:hypothetical protein
MVLATGHAHAVSVLGTAEGSFSSLSSCDSDGKKHDDCRILNTANGNKTQVQWGSQSSSTDFKIPSTLTAVDVAINANTDALGVKIGQLDWYNSATLRLNNSLDVFAVKWSLGLNFTAPSGSDPHGGEMFDLTIKNPVNPAGDSIFGLSFADLSDLRHSFSLNGVTVSNFRYQVADGAGPGVSTFLNNVWYNPEYNNASLYILADFRAPTVIPPPPVSAIPEPETYALLLGGLSLLGFDARRRRKKTNVAP